MDDEREPNNADDELLDDGAAPDDDLVDGGPTQAGFDRSENADAPPVPGT